eukprot:6189333-Pleurochrysis_carterae.AAC.1
MNLHPSSDSSLCLGLKRKSLVSSFQQHRFRCAIVPIRETMSKRGLRLFAGFCHPPARLYVIDVFDIMDSSCDASKRLKQLCTLSRTSTHSRTITYPGASTSAHPHHGTAPARTRSQATAPAEDKYIESECAYNFLYNKRLFGLIRGHVTDPAMLQETNATANSNGKSAWAILQNHGQPLRSGLTNINDDSK